MAEQSQARMLSAAFPTPPPYYKQFTKENVTRIRQIRKEAAANRAQSEVADEPSGIDISSLPAELQYLVPPEPPADGRYKSFGGQYDLAQPAQSLSAAGIPELYPVEIADQQHFDPTAHLQSLTRSILLNFLELVGTLSVNPTQGPPKVEDLQNLFYNVHDLINRYRPHQARESLILMMEEQADKIKDDIRRVNEAKEKMETLLKGVEGLQDVAAAQKPVVENAPKDDGKTDASDVKRRELQKSMWDALEQELGD
ncbi:hypothetical protein BT93_L0970 [Corymbia citriodora subsp. variegata]|uniref:Mediator of RNA polymerase II transcription subunit 7 n=1 Tax=Corymbia citriodora subsp. variegata TaxID=360336 RepID=A0A8T0CIR2_CORYI|nr:hypothetical protein BT93_L0970 [Corymbia citriodora subsp. variegata]